MSWRLTHSGKVIRATFFAALAAVCTALPARPPQSPLAQTCSGETRDVVELAPGVTWTHLCREAPANPNAAPAAGQPLGAPGGPWSIHILEIQRHRRELVLQTQMGTDARGQLARVPLTQLAAQAVNEGEEVLAAINGDFDMAAPYLGIPTGLAVSGGKVWTAGGPARPVLAVFPSGLPAIGVPDVSMTLHVEDKFLPIDSLNKPMGYAKEHNLRIYTRAFQSEVRAAEPFRAAIIKRLYPPPPLTVHGVVRGVVAEVRNESVVQPIPEGALLVAEPPESRALNNYLKNLHPGDRVILGMWIRMGDRGDIQEAVGGFPILMTGGSISLTHQGELGEYIKPRHPRTAACFNDDKIIFVAVDGRQPKLSVGMTLEELAELMQSLGCAEAVNTDGGGSTEMAVRLNNFKVFAERLSRDPALGLAIVNSPSDGRERGRPNAWVLVRKPL